MRRVAVVSLSVLALTVLAACAPEDREPQLEALSRWEDQRLAPTDSLLSLLGSRDAIVRRAALRTAGLIGRTDVLPAMIDALGDRSQAIRCQAAFSLGLLGGDIAVPPLQQLLADSHLAVRVAACEGLAQQRHDGTGLFRLAMHGERREAEAAWTALRNVAGEADHDSLVAAIGAGLARPDASIRWRALRCAERSPDPTLVELIRPFATDRDVQVRVHALRALGQHAGTEALEAVLESCLDHDRLKKRDLHRVQIAELRALGTLAAPVFAADPEGEHTSPAGRSVAAITSGAASEDPYVATSALDAMTAAVGELPLPPEAAERESLVPRWRARLVDAARERLQDPAPAVRAAAAAAFGALFGHGAVSALEPMLADADPAVAAAACAALLANQPRHGQACQWCRTLTERHGRTGEAGVLAAMPRLIARLRETGALWTPITRFPRTDDPACLPSLAWWRAVRGLENDDFVVRAQAAAVLGQLPGERSRDALVTAWERERRRGNVDVQLALLEALGALFDAEPQDRLDFEPRCVECVYFEAVGEEHPDGLEPAAADPPAPEVSRTAAAAALAEAFDHPELRVRLAAREAALATDLLTDDLIPSRASLRETAPAVRRDPAQPARRLPFKAPRVRCVTDRGAFVIELDAETAPNTCAAFLGLIEWGFHDALTFHRVVPDFVIQGGCPRGDGWGDPGWTIREEWSRTPFTRGTVGLATSGKDTGGSQWFVCHSPQPHLDARYTAFGQVSEGIEVIDDIQRGDAYRLEILAD
ncbi:MAG TPA: peptidylprolyl isomerase [Candidatus Krumholzibacteria bacterium]|nr:peptidylprolyl isomerase [Candidatus Krumholzibacteria bacterium]HPD72665.1 peptidylprolyl isomerase [Candidatus Krumholzibacteria bacterium]HRY40403.1 peptidylprolyl isomerase [Candidatus Krumholzibacteria bacterium]